MSEYSVQITEKLLGTTKFIAFGSNDFDTSQVLNVNDAADKSGISVGDTLTSINDIPISQITRSLQYTFKELQYIFYDQRLPFTAKFKKAETDINESGNETTDIQIETDNVEINEYIHAESANSPLFKVSPRYSSDDSMQSDLNVLSDDDLFEKHIIQTAENENNKSVFLNKVGITNTNKICFVSPKGLGAGYHEWSIEILKCDVDRQEIGVIGTLNMDDIKINKFGACSIYGNELSTNSMYYGSYNDDGSTRCFRDLSKKHHIGWCTGDIIKIRIDLNKWKIKFYLNGVNVRKALSLQQGHTYYPILSFAGNCQYQFLN